MTDVNRVESYRTGKMVFFDEARQKASAKSTKAPPAKPAARG